MSYIVSTLDEVPMRRNFESRVIHILLWLCALVSLGVLAFFVKNGPTTAHFLTHTVAGVDLSIAFRIDALSSIMFTMVALLGAVIGHYAVRYLDGEKQQNSFHRCLFFTVLSVFVLVLSNNLMMFFAAWLTISWGLHRLLLFYPQRPEAMSAARKKFLVSRLGDVLILAAIFLLYHVFGTFDFDTIFSRAKDDAHVFSSTQQLSLDVASILLVMGAMTKSVQFPFHFWLPETMETPTPVSALMHAGIINAGGFLVIRLSEVISHGEWASGLLTFVGAFTAVYGALVMATQNSIKAKLAYSTISQMGMMMFACGLGAFHFALFHIIAHSFYKAHAFLSTGALVDEKKRLALSLKPLPLAYGLLFTAACYGFVLAGYLWQGGAFLAQGTYLGVLALGLCQSVQRGPLPIKNRYMFSLELIVLIVAATSFYVVSEQLLSQFVAIEGSVQPHFWVCSATFAIFAAGFLISREMMEGRSPIARSLYITLWNDSYLASRTNRVVAKLWST